MKDQQPLALDALLRRLSPSLSAAELLCYFYGGKHPHDYQSTVSLLQALERKQLILYHWPHAMARLRSRTPGRYNPAAKPPTLAKGPLAEVQRGGYQAPFVPNLTQLDAIANTLEKARHLDKAERGQQALAQHPAPAAVMDPINDYAPAAAQGVDTQALAGDVVINTVGSTYSGLPALAIDQTQCAGEPISLLTGEELLKLTDFTLKGPLPLTWWRVYRSSNPHDCGLGHGWRHSLDEWLSIEGEQLQLHDAEGRLIPLPLPAAVGDKTHNIKEQLSLFRDSDTRWVITPLQQSLWCAPLFHTSEGQ